MVGIRAGGPMQQSCQVMWGISFKEEGVGEVSGACRIANAEKHHSRKVVKPNCECRDGPAIHSR